MIRTLKLKNFVLFEEETIHFNNNINALVGDTGSGKSVIFSAIEVLCGGRNIKKNIMKGKDFYELEMVIELKNINNKTLLKINSIFNLKNSEEITIYRKLHQDNKSIIKINGILITLNDLKMIMANLVEIHFQNSTEEILKEENQINIIDDLIDDEILEQYNNKYSEYIKQKKIVKKLNDRDENKEEQLELLEFQIKRLKKIKDIEDEETLEKQKLEFENIDKVRQVNEAMENNLNQIYDGLNILKRLIDDNIDLGYKSYKEIVDNAYYEIENLNYEHSKNQVNVDSVNIEEVTDKLSELKSLKRKYNLDYEGLLDKYEQLTQEKNLLDNIGAIIVKEEKKLNLLKEELLVSAKELSVQRQGIASKLEQIINKNFQDLDMPNASMLIKIDQIEVNDKGIDEVNLLLKTNKGHDMQNIAYIASGGEKSRIMLIFKIAINTFKNKKVFLLDEIDQGISSTTAKKVGMKLQEFAKDLQIIIISHTVQVISLADYLYEVKKYDTQDITLSYTKELKEEEKTNFIAKYLEI